MDAAAVPVLAALATWLVAAAWLSVVDLRTATLPTPVIWWAAGAVWACYLASSLLIGSARGLVLALAGALVCAAPLAAVHLVHPPSMGFGDVRFSVLNGLMCGWWGWEVALAGLALAFCAALPQALVVMARHGARASRPLGPYLALGAAIAAAWGAIGSGLAAGA